MSEKLPDSSLRQYIRCAQGAWMLSSSDSEADQRWRTLALQHKRPSRMLFLRRFSTVFVQISHPPSFNSSLPCSSSQGFVLQLGCARCARDAILCSSMVTLGGVVDILARSCSKSWAEPNVVLVFVTPRNTLKVNRRRASSFSSLRGLR